jgi:mono/diheme cytochrome c family protein
MSQEVPSELTPSALAGASIFGTKGCIKCHSIAGLRGKMGLDPEAPPETWSFYGLAADMWNHMPVMTSSMDELGIERPHLDPGEIADLVVFIFNRVNPMASGDAVAGRSLFGEKRCIRCHQVGGIGGIAGPSLDLRSRFHSPIRLAAAMWNHGPEMTESMRAEGIPRSALTGSELVDLYAYFSATAGSSQEVAGPVLPGSAGRGRGLYRSKGCRGCHGSEGRGGRGPNLARRDREWGSAEFAAAMWNKAPAMLAQMQAGGLRAPRLTAGEMADVVAYLYSLRYFEGAGRPELGRVTIRDRGCLDCHSLDGEGREGARDLTRTPELDTPVSVIAALWNHVTLLEDLPRHGGQSWPSFDEQEMANLVSFFQAQP